MTKARKLLDWVPHPLLKEGLVRTIVHFEEFLKEEGVRALVCD